MRRLLEKPQTTIHEPQPLVMPPALITRPADELKLPNLGTPQMTASERRLWEDGCKAQARLLLSAAGRRRLQVPSYEEWVGLNLLDRDGEVFSRPLGLQTR